MRRAPALVGLAVMAFGLAACGGGSSASSTSHHRRSSGSSSRPPRTYRLAMMGSAETPPGASRGRGAAVIAIHGVSHVCWRFSHLHGFTEATFAHIHKGAPGRSGNVVVPLSTGPRLHHQGCTSVSGALVKAIERSPRDYYVNIHSKRYPGGAVRAQL